MDLIYPSDVAAQTTSYTSSAASSLPTFLPGARGVFVWSTTDCYVKVGESVTATSSDIPIPAYTPLPIVVPKGTGAKWTVSARGISASGSVFAKPINGGLG